MNTKIKTTSGVEFTKITNDSNGNPRYVCHYTALLSEQNRNEFPLTVSPIFKVNDNLKTLYTLALRKAKTIGGKKFHNKQYSGGIVFQSYNLNETAKQIIELKTV